ncbi:MAG TPA: DUF3943 domain-containing protein [Ignavibacteria bacterium]|nr:DUF3943 domain-containing protein [Ignavibacteria bacterium]
MKIYTGRFFTHMRITVTYGFLSLVLSIGILPSFSHSQINTETLIDSSEPENFTFELKLKDERPSSLAGLENEKPKSKLTPTIGLSFRKKGISREDFQINLYRDSLQIDSVYVDTVTNTVKIVKDTVNIYKPWESRPHFWNSLWQMGFVEYFPFFMAKYVRDWGSTPEQINWTKVSWDTWRRNLRDGFEYDGDNFLTNYFAHPYHGNLFYNAGRTNGYNFWESSIYAFVGSGLWEMFGETFRPSFNDLITTTVNGINFGETMFKLSAMMTDNQATGFERTWREVVGGIINPVRGVTRLISGESWRIFPNPDYARPESFKVKVYAGMRRLDNSSEGGGEIFSKGQEQGIYGLDVVYGDVFDYDMPFSYFTFGTELNSGSPQFGRLYSNGHIFGITLKDKKDVKHKLNFTLDYSYANNPGYQYGQTSVIPNLMSKYKFLWGTELLTQVGLNAVIMGGTNTDYFVAADGRDYDLGPGLGVLANFELRKNNWAFVKLMYTNGWIFSMTEPQDSKHNLNYVTLEINIPLQKYFAVGLIASVYWRYSFYDGSPDVTKQVPIAKLYFSTLLDY